MRVAEHDVRELEDVTETVLAGGCSCGALRYRVQSVL